MTRSIWLRVLALVGAAFLLAACDSSEERAEQHYQRGMELLEAGDVDRALVEFRNVFQLNGQHREARLAYARTVRAQGNLGEAYGQYLRLVEQYPDDLEGRRALSEMAVLTQNWEEAERHAEVANTAAPDDEAMKAVNLALRYRDALEAEDPEAQSAVITDASALVASQPDNLIIRRILADGYLRAGAEADALRELDEALRLDPDNRQLHNGRLALLGELGDAEAIEVQLLDMTERFPEDSGIKATLIRFYLSQQNLDGAEAFMRAQLDPTGENTQPYVELIQFLVNVRGREAALAELDAALAEDPDSQVARALRAGLLFEQGDRDTAIAEMESLLDGAEASDQTNGLRISLAQMLVATGNEVGARRLVEEVLEADPTQVQALKMSAAWAIEADRADEAISALRTVLDQAPQDADAMTLMAEAHQRNGNRALARDLLALAAEASNNAPEESLRYARLLMSEDSALAAEDVLLASLRLSPGDPRLLEALGQIYVGMEDWPRAEQVIATLRRIGSDQAVGVADSLQVAVLSTQDRTGEAIAFLEELSQDQGRGDAAQIAIMRAHLVAGDSEAALAASRDAIAENPDSLQLRFAGAAILAATGDLPGAADAYREILAINDRAERVWLELIRVLNAQGDTEAAQQALNEGLAVLPEAPNLLWAKASDLERDGDFEGAIAVYESLYERNSRSPVIANNLASLISTYRDDAESLERAYAVARRLRGTEVPAFQDTYGWIAYRRGEYEDALEHLEPAAAALGQDALVQYHLGMTYAALERYDEALGQLRRAVDLAGEIDTRPQFDQAREEIERLENLPAE